MLDLEKMRLEIEQLMPRRAPHVLGCEQMAAKLAERWGVDEQKIREAALLHDITKYYSPEEQLKTAKKYGIITDSDFFDFPNIVHAYTGAAVAKYEYGLDDEQASAIYWHTTGKADMTTFEKIICLADYIEPSRSFAGLDELRTLAFEDLDEALLCEFVQTIEFVMERRMPLNDNMLKAYNYILQTKQKS